MKKCKILLLFLLIPIIGFSQTIGGAIKIDGTNIILLGKQDIGPPGVAGGLDIGEGGSYTTDKDGVTIVFAAKYDSSETSGSRFTNLTLGSSNTWLGGELDRFCVGSTKKFWAMRISMTQAKSSELLQAYYYNGTNLVAMDHMGIKKAAATTTGQAVLEQTAEKEYVTWDQSISSAWSAADNVTDKVPNFGTNVFLVCLEVPSGGLTTPVISDEIKVRGTDFDFVTGASYPVYWGEARIEKHTNISLSVVKVPAGVTVAEIDMTSAHKKTVFVFDGAGDNTSFEWSVPEATDTSNPIEVKLTYSADANDTFTIDLTALKIKNATTIGSGVSADYTSTTNITAAAANVVYIETTLMATKMSIQDMASNDSISFEIQRTDASNIFYPHKITVHYTVYSTGEHK